MASFECIFAKNDNDYANNKVFHCVKAVLNMSFYLYIYILVYIRDLELHYIHRRHAIETLPLNSNQEM